MFPFFSAYLDRYDPSDHTITHVLGEDCNFLINLDSSLQERGGNVGEKAIGIVFQAVLLSLSKFYSRQECYPLLRNVMECNGEMGSESSDSKGTEELFGQCQIMP